MKPRSRNARTTPAVNSMTPLTPDGDVADGDVGDGVEVVIGDAFVWCRFFRQRRVRKAPLDGLGLCLRGIGDVYHR